jgi:Gpi18-like mannosyltransferase
MQTIEAHAAAARPAATPTLPTVLTAAGVLLAVALHWLAWPTQTPDMTKYLLPWYQHILAHGPLGAFAHPFSNYTPAYLYLLAAASLLHPWIAPVSVIKLLSVAGTGVLAIAVASALKAAGAPRPWLAGALVFLLPTTILNAALLGQCDAFWTAACVMAVAAAIRGRMVAMLVWCGIAIAFKAQPAFLAPFIFAVLLHNRAKAHLWLIPPAVYAAVMSPAWLAGWPALDLLLIYPRQNTFFPEAGNAANPWVIVGTYFPAEAPAFYWIGYGAAALALVAYVALFARRRMTPKLLLAAATLSALIIPWLLPKMHERYFMLADLLSFALAFAARGRSTLLIAVLVQFASVSAYFSYAVSRPLWAMLAALISAGALVAIADYIRRDGVDVTA